jgi:eukaryotic-like serine/threonine-protein kinase
MPDSNWENLQEAFHAALAMPVAERAAFIERSSKGDESLRNALESLLKSHEETNNILDTPAYQAAAEMLVDRGALVPGQLVAHYTIISLLGEGGMGRVYLAQDTKLHRRVCLKFLSARFTENPEWLRRFEQEARAASALNNPNILTIYEIGEAEGRRFIATEFIEGQTLRERLRSGLDLQSAINIAIQIASALVAAHRVNIVHRDIKPENVMVRDEDGLVKVLDFGLAKITVEEPTPISSIPSDIWGFDVSTTNPGVLMGTVAYMSPEQARGEAVDARTDIWSLGIVLYEMVSGHVPFGGSTSTEILSAIVSKEAPALKSDDLPDTLTRIIAKVLSNNRERRYAASQELLEDLNDCRELVRNAARIEQSRPSPSTLASSTTTNGNARQPTSSAEYLVSKFSTHKNGVLAVAAIVLLTIVTVLAVYGWRAKQSGGAANTAQIKSLAVLPFRSVGASDNYLGIGIADAVIRKIGQTGKLTVRPTSAVLRYAKDNVDSMEAARELGTDAILEGTVQRAGDRLRVTVNLLRINDGASIYSDNFDLSRADVFAIEDQVAQQVASQLQVSIKAVGPVWSNEKYPTDPKAYEWYIRGVAGLDERGFDSTAMPQMLDTIGFFKKAIEIDPQYALPHAELAFAYAWTAIFLEPGEAKWVDLARAEIKESAELNPNMAESHLARGLLLWSSYEGYQNAEALRELRLAKQLSPNGTIPELPAIYAHVGLDDLAAKETNRQLEINPTSQALKSLPFVLPYLRADPDAWFAQHQRIGDTQLYNAGNAPWYYLRKGRLDDAQRVINERLPKDPPDKEDLLMRQAFVLALRGNFSAAQTKLPDILAKIRIDDENRHHFTYDAACIYALAGNSSEAVRWLKETAATGFPNYPLFARDPFLDRVRQTPEFIQFMAEQRAQWEKYRQEFGG